MKRILIPEFEECLNYVDAVRSLGCEPCVSSKIEDPDGYDALILPGGGDVDPRRYQEEDISCRGVKKDLDELQFRTLDAFVNAGKPVFGICRGHQLINVYFGGSLYQHIGSAERHAHGSDHKDKVHLVKSEQGSYLGELYGEEFFVNSSHHQAVRESGDGLHICLWSDDEVVEGMHHESLPIYSVQWHPERMCFRNRREDTVDGSIVLRWFLEEIVK